MTKTELVEQIRIKKSMLCVGLDTDITKIPKGFLNYSDPIFEFNKAILDATAPYAVAIKPNLAFYESQGVGGWQTLKKTIEYQQKKYPELFSIADAKRGDIGNTADMYAKAFFEQMGFDAVTIAPYMGKDSITPFLQYKNKWTIVLGLTSNAGALDFQMLPIANLQPELPKQALYLNVMDKVAEWGNQENTMFVVGATQAVYLKEIRKRYPEHFFLVPGVGAQGATLQEVVENGLAENIYGLLINSSRGILYASNGEDFAEKAALEAQKFVGNWN